MMPPPPAFAPPPPGAPSQGPLRRSFESVTCCAPCRAVVGRLPIRGWFMKADAGGGDGPGKGGGGGTGFYRWWRDEGGPPRPAKAALVVLLALTLLACWRQLTAVEGLGPLPWTEELSHYLQGLAAEWEVPAGSSYAKAIGGAGSRTELVDAIDQAPVPPPSRTNWTRLVPPSRTKWTRLVPSPVLNGHVSRTAPPALPLLAHPAPHCTAPHRTAARTCSAERRARAGGAGALCVADGRAWGDAGCPGALALVQRR